MLAISVEFLHGTFRGDPDGTASTGQLTRGEWPPSPALVAADGTGSRSRVTDGRELAYLEALPPPVIHADGNPEHRRIQPRYVVVHQSGIARATHQEYVARTGALHRSGVRVTPRESKVIYVWKTPEPDDAVLLGLQRRAARVGYLGGSDSPVRLRVATGMPKAAPIDRFTPDREGDTRINVVAEGDVAALDRFYEAWTDRGASVSRLQFPALQHQAVYRSPGFDSGVDIGEVVAWLLLRPAMPGRRISMVSALFKAAILSHYQRLHGEPPAILHGHGFSGTGYELARYLVLPDVGHTRSRGRIHGLALWLPPGSDAATRRNARLAALAIESLNGPGVDVQVVPHDDERRPWAANPNRWAGPSRRWSTAFPAVHERRRSLDLPELVRWCRHVGLPNPVAFRSTRAPLVPGAIDLAPVEVNRPGRPALPYSHVELSFEESVVGPVVIGSGRQRGLGLCLPTDD